MPVAPHHDWRTMLGDKLMPGHAAVRRIRPGDAIYLSAGSAAPLGMHPFLCDPAADLSDHVVHHLLTLGPAPYVTPECEGRFRHNALFIGPNVREAVSAGRADFTPVFLSEIPALIRSGRVAIEVAIVSLTPPDPDGWCSFGTHVDLSPAACEAARVIIGQVNPRMPYVYGDSRIHIDRVTAFVEAEHGLPESAVPRHREETQRIARHVAELIPNGATLQLGIGGIPDGVLKLLVDHRDLGIHSEMFTDGVVELVERGVITGACKTLHPGKIVASFAFGTQRLYDFLNRNQQVEFYPSDYVNDPFVIARHDDMIAINTCIQIDLTGQVCSDSIGARFYSGIGGQVDFIRGAARARRGKPILALPSTAQAGIVSRIVPRLDDGAGVVTTRGDVHWVVTEYGAVNLHGLCARERAMALISIAHPRFRPWLLAEAKQRRLVYVDQLEPQIRMPLYPHRLETRFVDRRGEELIIRPVKTTDESLLADLFHSLSEDSIHQRFLSLRRSMPRGTLQDFCTIDYEREMVLLAIHRRDDVETAVGWAMYTAEDRAPRAEASFVVADAWQNRGIGGKLMQQLAEIAIQNGFRGFTATILSGNGRMLRVFEKCGHPLERRQAGDVIELTLTFRNSPPAEA